VIDSIHTQNIRFLIFVFSFSDLVPRASPTQHNYLTHP
jgi:hypothetical protein